MTVYLKDLASKITKGTTPSNIGESFSESGVMYFRSELLGKSKYIDKSNGLLFITESVHQKLKRSQIQKGDMLFSMAGAYLGKISLVREGDYPSNTNQAVAIIRLIPGICDSDYLYYYMTQKSFNEQVYSFCAQAAQPNINLKQIGRLKINLPTIATQQKIASILSAYDFQIENNKKRIKLLEQMAENLYKEWFVRFRFPGYETAEFEGEVPKGWLFEKLNDFGIILETGSRPKGGIDASVENGIPSLGAEAINELAEFDYNNFKLVSLDYYNSMKRGKSKGDHILVYKDGAYIGKATLFRNAFPFNTYSINEHVFFLNTKDVNYQNYLYFTLHQPVFFTMMQNLNRNAAQPGLSQQDMFGIKVFKPTINVVTAFNSFVEPILDEVFNLAKENRLLTTQRDLLLPRLMSGKLSI